MKMLEEQERATSKSCWWRSVVKAGLGGGGEGTSPRIMGWGRCELKTFYDPEGRRISGELFHMKGPASLFWILNLGAGIFDFGHLSMVVGCTWACLHDMSLGVYVCFDVMLVFMQVSKCFFCLGGLSGGAWGRLGDHWEATWSLSDHLGQVKRTNEIMQRDMVISFW